MTPGRLAFCFWVLTLLLAGMPTAPGYACPDLASAPHSRWWVVTQDGVSWLYTPCGERFFSIGVNVVNGGYPSRIFQGRLAYHWPTFYPTLEHWAATSRQRLLSWGFNTVGAWSVDPTHLPLPFIPDLELGRESQFHWLDPFHPAMAERMRVQAHRLVAPYKGNPYRIGYFSDNEIGWWYGALFTFYLQKPATNYTKQKLIALVRAHYKNDWPRFRRDFVPPAGVTSFDALLQKRGTMTRLRIGGTGIQIVRHWTSMVAEHYYRLVHQALREADPEALIFADRLQIYYDPNAIRPMAPYIDAVATNYNVDSHDGWIARYYFDGLLQLTGHQPILVSEWFFAAAENRTGNRNNGHLMTVQTQQERARGAAAATQWLARIPQLIGLHWFQYYDHPPGGRPDGEDYNFGLVDINDQPYEELTAALRQVNPQLAGLHQTVGPVALTNAPTNSLEIPAADVNPHDHTLDDWPKEQALVPGLMAPAPEIVFGDIYLAWSQAGVYLATISMDYYDPRLLAYGDIFPLEEAFRLDWGIDAGSGPQRFALYIIPPKVYPPSSGPAGTRAHLCRLGPERCTEVPAAVASYFGADSPRIVAEVFLPWSALKSNGPPAEQQLRMELAATAYHRARWMSWSGTPPAVALEDSTTWRVVRLANRRQQP